MLLILYSDMAALGISLNLEVGQMNISMSKLRLAAQFGCYCVATRLQWAFTVSWKICLDVKQSVPGC
jgi:hypothetical protein